MPDLNTTIVQHAATAGHLAAIEAGEYRDPVVVWQAAERAWTQFVQEQPLLPSYFEQARLFISVFSAEYGVTRLLAQP